MMNRKPPPKKALVGKRRGITGRGRDHRTSQKRAFYDVKAVLKERGVSGRMAQFLKERVKMDEGTLYRLEECRKDRVFQSLEQQFNDPKATPEEISRARDIVEKFLSKEIRVFEYNALKKAFGLD